MKKSAVAALLLVSAAAHAQVLSFLVREWMRDGSRFCEYDNGTVLNVGVRLCPLNIKVSP